MRPAASRTLAPDCHVECLAMKLVGELDAGNRHVQFDERGRETECWPSAPSHRARPRLYQSVSPRMSALAPPSGYKRTYRDSVQNDAKDPSATLAVKFAVMHNAAFCDNSGWATLTSGALKR